MPADCKSLNNTSVASGLSSQTCSILSKYSGSFGSNVSNLLNKRNESTTGDQSHTEANTGSRHECSRDNNGNEDSGVSTIGSGCGGSTAGNSSSNAGDVLRRRTGESDDPTCSLETGENNKENRLSSVSTQSKNGNTTATTTSVTSSTTSKRFSGMSIDSHHSSHSHCSHDNHDVSFPGVHVAAKRESVLTESPSQESPVTSSPVTSPSSSGRTSPVLTSDDDVGDNFSKGCLSLEFDDYPLDLVSPITKVEEDNDNDKMPWRPTHLREITGYQKKQTTSTPKYNGDRLSFMEYNEILYDAGTDDQRGFVSKRTSTPKYPQSKQDRLSGYMYDALKEYPPRSLFRDRLSIKDKRESGGETRGPCGCLKTLCGYICRPFMRQHNPMPEKVGRCGRLHHALLCPPKGALSDVLTLVLAGVVTWGVLWGLTRDQALPGGNIFALLVLFAACSLAGAGARKVGLPSILGMLVVGCLLRNVPAINIGKDVDVHWAAAIRTMALVVVLLRAGYGLDPESLRKMSSVILRLAFLPLLVETIAVAVAAHYLLHLPLVWAFMLGFVLSAVTPAVVVPAMLHLQARSIGTNHDIPSLVIAAAGIDDILAITGFTVFLGVVFSNGNVAVTVLRGPLEALAGAAYGALLGVIISYVPHKNHKHVVVWRMFLLLGATLFAAYASVIAGCPGGGAFACLVLGFITGLKWKKQATWKSEADPIAKNLGRIWVILEPMLFGLIGIEADIKMVKGHVIGMSVAVILIGAGFRMVTAFLAVCRSHLTVKERFFIPFAWLPKATVQAAIGSVALDAARVTGASEELVANGTVVVATAVLSILIMAPVGAATIGIAASCCLHKPREDTTSQDSDVEGGQLSPNAEDLTWDDHLDFDTEFTKMRLDFDRSKPMEITTEMETVT